MEEDTDDNRKRRYAEGESPDDAPPSVVQRRIAECRANSKSRAEQEAHDIEFLITQLRHAALRERGRR